MASYYSVSSISLLFLFSSLCLAFGNAQKCNFPAIFNFGDSNSDTGGASAALGQAGPPNGETFFKTPVGRYSDGRLIIDFIAEGFGLRYLSAFLDSVGSNFSHGANFATAGSTIKPLDCNLNCGYSPISLDIQSTEYTDFHNRSQKFRGLGGIYDQTLPAADYFSRALYTFDIGQNDLTSFLPANLTIDELRPNVSDLVDRLKNTVKDVYGQGGRYFWIHNTGPVGCLAYVLEPLPVNAEFDSHGCAVALNQLAQDFNKMLKEAVIRLRNELPEAAITYVDIYSLKYSLFANPQMHGFTQPLETCCGRGGKYNFSASMRCGTNKMVDGKEIYIGPCKDPSKAVVWDGVHYTEAANKYVYDRIVTGAFSDLPVPLNMACHRQYP